MGPSVSTSYGMYCITTLPNEMDRGESACIGQNFGLGIQLPYL